MAKELSKDGGPIYNSNDFGLEVAKGDIQGHSVVHKFGSAPDIDTADGSIALWHGTKGLYTGFNATGAETVELFSSDANDTAAGTGARTVQVYGLDANYALQNETVTLNGVTAVDTANTYIRVFRGIVRSAGTGATNAGTITARQKTTTANVFFVLPIGYGQTMVCAYTIPAATTGYLGGWYASIDSKTTSNNTVRLMMRPDGEAFQVKQESVLLGAGTSHFTHGFHIPLSVSAKTDIVIRSDTDTNNAGVSGGFSVILVED